MSIRLNVIIVLLTAGILSCTSKSNEYQSKYHDNLNIIKEDSLSLEYTDSLIINRIQTVVPWKQYLLIEDARSLCLWVFDRQLKFITVIGKRGKGPGEFTHSCMPIVKGDSLLIFDYRLRKIHIYDTTFQYLGERTLPLEISARNTPFLVFHQHYILSGLYLGQAKAIAVTKDYVRNNKSTYILDSNFRYKADVFPWDKLYENEEHSSFNSTASAVNFALGPKNSFFAHQIGDYKIAHFDSSFQLRTLFGIKSSNAKDPPRNEDIAKKSDSRSRGSILFTQSSLNMATLYDSVNNVVLSYFGTATEESFYKRDPLIAKHFLQIYDATTYDCIFDGTIPGILLFTEKGKIYILTEDNAKKFTLGIFKIQQK